MHFRAYLATLALLASSAAPAADTQTHTTTVNDQPTTVSVRTSALPMPSAHSAFGLFPEITVEPTQDRRPAGKSCFGTAEEDRRIVGAVAAQALSAAGYFVVPAAPLKIAFSIDELNCAAASKTERQADWRLSGIMSSGTGKDRILDVSIKSGRSVTSDFPPGAADNFRDIDTPQGVAAASLRDRLRDMFRSKQFQPE